MEKKKKTIKKEFSRFVVPSLTLARKRLTKDTNVIKFNLGENLKNFGENKYYLLKTYGCQGNLADSEKMAGILEAMGYKETTDDSLADVIIFNTCAIRENAEERVFGEIGRFEKFRKKKPNMLIGICGCMPQEERTINKIKKTYPHINIVFGTHNIAELPKFLYNAIIEQSKTLEVLSIEGHIYEDVPVEEVYLDENLNDVSQEESVDEEADEEDEADGWAEYIEEEFGESIEQSEDENKQD